MEQTPFRANTLFGFVAIGLACALTTGCLAEAGADDEALEGSPEDGDEDSAAMELGPNIVKNAGFESGWNYWKKEIVAGGAAKLVTGAGTYLRTTTLGETIVYQLVSVTPGKKYHLLVKTRRRSGSGGAVFGVAYADSSGVQHQPLKYVSGGTSLDWHWRSLDATAPSWAKTAYVFMGGFDAGSASTYDWDGVGMHAY